MSRVLVLAVVLGAGLAAVTAQVSPQVPAIQAGPSDYLLFRFFFIHVMSVESAADNLKANGRDDAAARSKFRDAAKLTDAEAELLKSVAARCNADLEAHARTEVAAAVQNVKAQYPGVARASELPPAAAAQLNAVQARHEKIVADHVQALKSGLGPDRFQKLYEFVRGTEAPRIKEGPIPRPQARQK